VTTGSLLVLELAPDPALLASARLFAAAAARAAGCDADTVEDVRLAVSEACTRAIGAASGDERVRIEAEIDGAGARLTVVGAPAGGTTALDDALPDVDLVRALFPEAREDDRDGRPAVTFVAAAGA
jgi:anti-sigma regulatory factor (Ser/Thr protein kinase)